MHSHDRTLLAGLGFQDRDKRDERHDLACQYLKQPEVLIEVLKRYALEPKGKKIIEGTQPSVTHVELEFHLTKGEGQYRTTIGFLDLAGSFEYRFLKEKIASVKQTSEYHWLYVTKRLELWWLTSNEEPFVYINSKPAYRITPETFKWFKQASLNTLKNTTDTDQQKSNFIADVMAELEFWTAKKFSEHSIRESERCLPEASPSVASFRFLIEVKINELPIGDILRQIKLYEEYFGSCAKILACSFPITESEIKILKEEGILFVFFGDKFKEFCAKQSTLKLCANTDDLEI